MKNIRMALLTTSLTVLLAATGALADDVNITIGDQAHDSTVDHKIVGKDNSLQVDLGSSLATRNTKLYVQQVGERNALGANIQGSNGDYSFTQGGTGNTASLHSYGDGNFVRGGQKGTNNDALINQTGTNSTIHGMLNANPEASDGGNEFQNGQNNKLNVDQQGSNQYLAVGQEGSSNSLETTQLKNNTLIAAAQTGNYNHAELRNENDRGERWEGLTVSQKGDRNFTRATLGRGTGTDARISQVGDMHVATLDTVGSYNRLVIDQSGEAATANLSVYGDRNTAKLTQSGEGGGKVINANIGGKGDGCMACTGTISSNENMLLVTQNNVSNQTVNAGIVGSANNLDVNLSGSNMSATYKMAGTGNSITAR